jgi:hypothetical protein
LQVGACRGRIPPIPVKNTGWEAAIADSMLSDGTRTATKTLLGWLGSGVRAWLHRCCSICWKVDLVVAVSGVERRADGS